MLAIHDIDMPLRLHYVDYAVMLSIRDTLLRFIYDIIKRYHAIAARLLFQMPLLDTPCCRLIFFAVTPPLLRAIA